jgi:UDP-N-acetylglucosamine 2-epimerase
VATVIGARPQFVKAATVSRRRRGTEFSTLDEVIIHTGQHYDDNMSDAFFRELDIPAPAHHLGVGSGAHGAQTGAMMERLEMILDNIRPDIVLTYGDTNSTLAAALTAAKAGLPLAHVEAGMRSFRRGMAEEVNRVVADRLSALLFCPTETAVAHLREEGIRGHIELTGDVMYDSFLHYRKCDGGRAVLQACGLDGQGYGLATLHRAENTDVESRLRSVLAGLERIAEELPFVLLLHPRTRAAMESLGIPCPHGVKIVPPQGYIATLGLVAEAAVVATDSGGLQKEAYFAATPCVTFREETEWPETLIDGWNTLVGVDAQAIVETIRAAASCGRPADPPTVFGDGDAAGHILRLLMRCR